MLTGGVKPIKLGDTLGPIIYNQAIALGWGRIGSGADYAETLQAIISPIVDPTVCSMLLPDYFNSKHHICLSFQNQFGKDICEVWSLQFNEVIR